MYYYFQLNVSSKKCCNVEKIEQFGLSINIYLSFQDRLFLI